MSFARFSIAPAIAAILSSALLVACESQTVQEAFDVQDPVQELVVSVDSGEVELVRTDSERVRVERTLEGPEGVHLLDTRSQEGVLTLEMGCEIDLACSVSALIFVPHGVEVAVDLGEGELLAFGEGLPAGHYALR